MTGERLKQYQTMLEKKLESYLPEEGTQQADVAEAMRYSLLDGGKRIRPVLLMEFCRVCGGDPEKVLPFACAVEMIHTYSLIHDDLPCMDDDMMRRGKASTWAEYGEDIGVLAGDALMMYAMETAAKAFDAAQDQEEMARVGQAMGILARKTGVYGMIGGQTVDVELTGKLVPKEKLDFIYRLKTGALLEASLMIGAVLAGADEESLSAMEQIAADVGFAFQIQDDILDVTSTEETLGKPVLSDEKNQKTTYVTLEGLEKAKDDVARISERAKERLMTLPGEKEFLGEIIAMLVDREN